MEHLRSIGTVVYLEVSYKETKDRLGDLAKRGVSIRKGQTLKDLYDERVPLYEKYAHITVSAQVFNIANIVNDIISKL